MNDFEERFMDYDLVKASMARLLQTDFDKFEEMGMDIENAKRALSKAKQKRVDSARGILAVAAEVCSAEKQEVWAERIGPEILQAIRLDRGQMSDADRDGRRLVERLINDHLQEAINDLAGDIGDGKHDDEFRAAGISPESAYRSVQSLKGPAHFRHRPDEKRPTEESPPTKDRQCDRCKTDQPDRFANDPTPRRERSGMMEKADYARSHPTDDVFICDECLETELTEDHRPSTIHGVELWNEDMESLTEAIVKLCDERPGQMAMVYATMYGYETALATQAFEFGYPFRRIALFNIGRQVMDDPFVYPCDPDAAELVPDGMDTAGSLDMDIADHSMTWMDRMGRHEEMGDRDAGHRSF